VAPYVRDEAEPVVRPATDARTDAWWPVFPFSGECVLYSPRWGKERKEESDDETNSYLGCVYGRTSPAE
jgi:hypothetical protein